MSCDRNWIHKRTVPGITGLTDDYIYGVEDFLNFAQKNCTDSGGLIRCPCMYCTNLRFLAIDDVRYQLYYNGFCESYVIWKFHGEVGGSCSQNETMDCDDVFNPFEMLRDGTGAGYYWNIENSNDRGARVEEPNVLASEFYKMVDDAKIPIYPGNTNFTKISFVTKLLHFKNNYGVSDKGFNELVKLIRDVLPANHTLPKNYYAIKKMVRGLNLGYDKIDACENDCMLFYGDDIDRENCRYCHSSRYKDAVGEGSNIIPKKILRYFSLTSRLQRLYMSSRTAKDMQWYKHREIIDGVLTHPADGKEWKQFDLNYPDFAREVRNIRVGLATDGFSPYSNAYAKPYSVWPVVMVVYNLPPSMCMKDPYMFMTLLIPGEKSPTRDINVYLRPLIDELKVLWRDGVQTYDAYSKTNFTMRTALMWTINDFPALGMVSGWSTHGKMSCPICIGDVKAVQLPHSRKCSFWGTSKQFLRKRKGQIRRTGRDVRNQCISIHFPPPGKQHVKDRANGFGVAHNWTHLTIFHELPYWDTLRLHHCIDVMHTEKNLFDNIFYTILDSTGKSKDNTNAREDLKALGIRDELWLRGTTKPRAIYNLTREQLNLLCKWVSVLKLPDGYASNIYL